MVWWLQLIVFVVLINTFWMTFLAVNRPDRFAEICSAANGKPYLDEKRGSSVRIIGLLIGYVLVCLIALRWVLGFLPNDWGIIDEYGEFQTVTDTLATLLSFPAGYMIFKAIGLAADRTQLRLETQRKLTEKEEELQRAWHKYAEMSDKLLNERQAFEQTKTSFQKSMAD